MSNLQLLSEEWKAIPHYEGLYDASNFGRIRNAKNKYILKPLGLRDGYKYVNLYPPLIKRERFLVHRLVALAFMPNPNNKRCVNHINSDRSDNRLSNLEWCTHRENTMHGIKVGNITQFGVGDNNVAKRSDVRNKISKALSGGNHYKAKGIIDTSNGNTYDCIQDAANAVGVTRDALKHYLVGSCKNKTTLKYLD